MWFYNISLYKKLKILAMHFQVLIGASSLGVAKETTRFFRGLQKLNMHPDYTNFYNGSDITVLKLDAPVDIYSYPNIKPACLPVTVKREA